MLALDEVRPRAQRYIEQSVVDEGQARDVLERAYEEHVVPHHRLFAGATVGQSHRHPSDVICYHYTDADGLLGIVRKQALWASCLGFMNDPSEYRYGVDLCLKHMAEVKCDSAHRRVLDSVRERLVNRRLLGFHAISFSTEGDHLGQWRVYAADGMGFAVGVRFPVEDSDMCPELSASFLRVDGVGDGDEDVYVHAYHILYSEEQQVGWLRGIMDGYTRALVDGLSGLGDIGSVAAIARRVEHVLVLAILSMKHCAYCDEHEVRVVVHSSPFHGRDVPWKCRKVRSSRGVLVPYVELKPADGQLPIAHVVIGPKAEAGRAEDALSVLLLRHNCPAVVKRSGVPYC